MQPKPDRPLFSQVGRDAAAPTDLGGRLFNLLIALGVLAAIGAFVAELATRPPALRYVEVDMGARPGADE